MGSEGADAGQSRQLLEEALHRSRRDHGIAARNLGVVYEREGDPSKAKECFEEARRLGDARAAGHLGSMCWETGDLSNAKKLLEEAWRKGDLPATCHLGVIHATQGQREKARKLYQEACRKGHCNGTYNLGLLYEEDGDLSRAKELFEAARDMGHAEADLKLGNLYLQEGNCGKAEESFSRGRRLGDTSAIYNLGLLYHEQGDLDTAMEMYEEARQQGHGGASSNLGTIYHKMGDLCRAETLYEEARCKGHDGATRNLSILLKQKGQARKAEELQAEAEQLYPVEGDRGFISGDRGASMAALKKGPWPAAGFKKGQRVRVKGLTSAVGQMLNERVGVVTNFDAAANRYGVKFDGDERSKAIRTENLEYVTSPGADPAIVSGFLVGDRVLIHGLACATGQLLNGRAGSVVRLLSPDRCGVLVDGERAETAIRPDNLSHTP